ncbi:hypothetical protein [Adlercreutzia sp. ZJ154]|uniref:hypothetical protein n=1 Tax=Adlercreutzia sp. ZJ154 TaxID=2709790 RepID=UPI0013EA8D96|nr:hypothetical protein [Adlercreutzia sp. ZJ154]
MESIAKKILAIVVACCMVTSLTPAAALAAGAGAGGASTPGATAAAGASAGADYTRTQENTERIEHEGVQEAADEYATEHTGEAAQATTEGASTSVSVRTLSEFNWTRWTGPQQNATIDDVADPEKASGNLVVEYEKGAPKKLDGGALGYEYSLEVTRTAFKSDGTLQSSGTTKQLTGGVVEDGGNAPVVTIVLKDALEEFAEESISNENASYFYGSYDFKIVTTGAAEAPECVVNFWIVPDDFLKDRINADEANPDNLYMTGAFYGHATLEATNIKAAAASGAASPAFTTLQSEAGANAIDTAYQLDVTNGTLFNVNELYKQVDTVTLPVSADLADKADGTISVLALVDGQVKRVEYKRVGSSNEYANAADSTDKLTFKPAESAGEGGEGGEGPGTGTGTGTSTPAHVTFSVKNLGAAPGAFAITYKSTQKFQVTTSATGGTIDEAHAKEFARGATPTFYFSPSENFYLANASDVVVSGLNADQYTLGANFITLSDTAAATNVTISITFTEYTESEAESHAYWKLDVSSTSETGASGEVSVDTVVLGADKVPTNSDTTKFSGSKTFNMVQAGSPVYLNLFPGEGSCLKSLKVNGVEVAVTGSTYTLSTMHDNASIEVVFAPGIPPAHVTYTVTGEIAEGSGNFGVSVDESGQHPITNYSATVVAGDFQHVSVNADEGYTIGSLELDGVAVSAAEGMQKYTLTITNVRANHNVVVRFVGDKVQISVPASVAGATIETNMEGTSPYSVNAGEDVEIYITPAKNYTLGKIVVGENTYTTDELMAAGGKDGYTLAKNSSGTYTLSFKAVGNVSVCPMLFPEADPDIPATLKTVDVAGHGGNVAPQGKHTLDAESGKLTLNFSRLEGDEYKDTHVDRIEISSNEGETATVAFADLTDKWSWVFDANTYKGTTFAIDVYFTEAGSGGDVAPEPAKADIVLAANAGCTIDPAGVQNDAGEWVYAGVNCGVAQSFTLIPETGYELSCIWLSVDGGKMVDVTNATYKDAAGIDVPYVVGNTLSFIPQAASSGTAQYKVYAEFKKSESEDPDYTQRMLVVRTDASGTGTGTTTPSGTTWTSAGEKQSISIIPDKDSRIDCVTLQDLDADGAPIEGTSRVVTSLASAGTLSITVDENTLVLVKFAKLNPGEVAPINKKVVAVTSAALTGGTISPAGLQNVLADASLSFSIKAQEGYSFAALKVTGEFESDKYEAEISPTDSRITANDAGDTFTYALPSDLITRFAKTDSVDNTGRINVIATFTAQSTNDKTWHVSTSVSGPSGAGYISPGMCEGQDGVDVAAGASQTFSFVNKAGYVVRAVYVDGVQVAAGVSEYTLENVVKDTDLRVEFAPEAGKPVPRVHSIETSVVGSRGGTVSPLGATDVNDGANISVTFIPDAGWRIKDVRLDGKSVVADVSGSTLELFNVSADHSVVVEYENVVTDTSLVLVEAKGPGRVSPAGAVELVEGKNTAFTFIANAASASSKVVDLTSVTVDMRLENGEIRTLGGADLANVAKTNDWTLDVASIEEFVAAQGHSGASIAKLVATFAEVDKTEPGGTPALGDEEQPPSTDARVRIEASAGYGGTIEPSVYEAVVPSEAGKINEYTFTVKPTAEYHVKDVSLNASGASGVQLVNNGNGTYTLKISSASNVGGSTVGINAEFEKNAAEVQRDEYSIEVEVQGAGSVYPGNITQAGGKTTMKVPAGGAQAFSFFPESGCATYIKVGQASIFDASDHSDLRQVAGSYSLSNISCDMRVLVVFDSASGSEAEQLPEYEKFTVKAQAVGGGIITPAGDTLVNAGANLVFTAKANAGHKLSYLAIDGTVDSDGNVLAGEYVSAADVARGQYTFANIQADHSVVAVFVSDTQAVENFTAYDLTLGGSGKGYASPSGVVFVKSGAAQSAEVLPNHGFAVKQAYFIDEAGSRVGSTYAPEAGESGVRVPLAYRGSGTYRLVAEFEAALLPNTGLDNAEINEDVSYIVNAGVEGSGGIVSPAGTNVVRAHAAQTFTLIPDEGYKVDGAYVLMKNGTKNPIAVDGNSFTLREVSSNMDVFAVFKPVAAGETAPSYTNHAVSVSANGPGNVYPAGCVQVANGKPFTFTLQPDNGALLKRLVVHAAGEQTDVTSGVVGLSYTVPAVSQDLRFVAEFANTDGSSYFEPDADVNVDVRIQDSSAVSANFCRVSPTYASLPKGSSKKFYIMPNDGYEVVSASVSSAGKTTPLPIMDIGGAGLEGARDAAQPYKYVLVNDIREDTVLNVVIKKSADGCIYDKDSISKVEVESSGGASVTPSGSDAYVAPGDTINMTATPATGEDITKIQIGDNVFVVPEIPSGTSSEDADKIIQGAVDSFNGAHPDANLEYNPADGSFTWNVVAGADGSVPQVSVNATDKNSPADVFYFDNLANVRTQTDSGYLVVTRVVDGKIYRHVMRHGENIPVSIGQEISIEAVADAGYKVKSVELDGFEVIDPGVIDEGCFKQKAYAAESEAAAVTRLRTTKANPTISYSFMRDESSSSGGSSSGDGGSGGSGGNVGKDQKYQITASSTGHGTVSPSGTMAYDLTADAEYNFMPDTGYTVSSISVDGISQFYSSTKYVYKAKDEKAGNTHTLEVTFTPIVSSGSGNKFVRVPSTLGGALSQLAKTGDMNAALMCALLAVACGATAVLVLTNSRKNRRVHARKPRD